MQFSTLALAALSGASVVSGHFMVTFPWWRGDSYATQWTYPCGGVNQSISHTNRTLWPLDGGSISFLPTHDWAQTHVNLGFGNNVTRLNVPLVQGFNQTGAGTFCFKKIPIPESVKSNVTEGVNATLQVIQLSTSGASLYNCMDITFSADAKDPSDTICFNSTEVGAANLRYPDVVPDEEDNNDDDKPPANDNGSGAENLKSSIGALAVVLAAGVAVLMA